MFSANTKAVKREMESLKSSLDSLLTQKTLDLPIGK
jgi:hypothetical protein